MTRRNLSTDGTHEIEEIASQWLIRRESGQWTETDRTQFEQWLDASTLNRVAFLRLELAWEDAARLKALGAGVSSDQPPLPGRWNLTPFFGLRRPVAETHDVETHRPRWRIAIAASVLIVVAAAIGTYQFREAGSDRYTTPVGGLASVPMPDGSNITLNTNSRVHIAVTEAERRVDLQQGEAFFEIAKDPNRPFVVAAGKRRVVALGTKFSVRREGDSIEVVVTEGQVRIEDAAPVLRTPAVEGSASATPAGPGGPVFLLPGTIARADEAGILVQRKSLPEAETRLSWRVGVLTLRDQSLADAVAEFNRYNIRRIVIADPAVAALRVEGNFRATNVDAFVRLIESGFPVEVAADEDRIVLSAR